MSETSCGIHTGPPLWSTRRAGPPFTRGSSTRGIAACRAPRHPDVPYCGASPSSRGERSRAITRAIAHKAPPAHSPPRGS